MPDVTLQINLNPALDIGKLNPILRELKAALGPLGKDVREIDAVKLKQSIREAKSETVAALEEFKKLRKMVDDTSKAGEGLGKSFKFNQIVEASERLAGLGERLSEPFVELDKEVRNIGTLGVKNFQEFEKLALDASKHVPESAAEIAAGVYDAISAGIIGSNEDVLAFVEQAGKLAVGGLSSTKDSVDLLTSIINAYKLKVTDTAKVTDILFNAVNVGKTTIPELNASLYQVVPAAAAVNVGIDQVVSAIATMTKQGTPTRQSATQIRQALIEIQKPGKELEPVLRKAGVSIESLAKEGLQESFRKIGVALREMGLNASQAFGSVDAASAVMLLSGDSAQLAAQDWQFVTTEIGATQRAFEINADSAQNKTKIILNNISSFFTGAASKIGASGIAITRAAAQIAPTFTGLVALKEIVPEAAISKTSTAISGKLLPTIAKIAPSLVTTSATGQLAFAGLGNAMKVFATNPVTIAIASVAALVIGIHYLADALHTTAAEQQEEIDAQIRMNEVDKKNLEQKKKSAEGTNRLATEYVLLSNQLKTVGDKAQDAGVKKERLRQITEQLNGSYPGVIKRTGEFNQNLTSVAELAKTSAANVAEFQDKIEKLNAKAVELSRRSLQNQSSIAKEELENFFTDQGASVTDKFGEFLVGTSGSRKMAEGFVDDFAKELFNAKNEEQLTDTWNKYADTIDKSDMTFKNKEQAKKLFTDWVEAQRKVLSSYKQDAQAAVDITAQSILQSQKQSATVGSAVADIKARMDEIGKKQEGLAVDSKRKIIDQKQSNALIAEKKALQEELKALEGDSSSERSRKSAFELAKQSFENKKKELDNEEKLVTLKRETYRIDNDVERSAVHQAQEEKSKLDYLVSQRDEFSKIFRLTEEGKFGISFKTSDEREDAENMIGALNVAIGEQENKLKEVALKVTVDQKKMNEDLRALNLDQLKFEIELGIITPSRLVGELESDLDTLRDRMLTAKDNEMTELLKRELALKQQIKQAKTDSFNDELTLLQRKQQKEDDAVNKQIEQEQKLFEKLRTFQERLSTSGIDKQKEEELKRLEKMKNAELVSEEEFQKRKEEIERNAADRLSIIRESIRGQEIVAQRDAELKSLNQQKTKIQTEIDLYKQIGLAVPKQLSTQFEDITKTIEEKGDMTKLAAEEFSSGLTDMLNNLFTADPEGIKAPFQKTLATLSGILRQMMNAAVLHLILTPGTIQSLSALPFPLNIVALPAIKAAITSALSALTGPLFDSILSFASGARVDQPTLAIVGDASRLGGGKDTEWILRDEHLWMIVAKAVGSVMSRLEEKFDKLIEEVIVLQNTKTVLKNDHIMIAAERSRAGYNDRIRSSTFSNQ